MKPPSGWASYSKFIRAMPDDELFTAARDLEALTQHPGWGHLERLGEYREHLVLTPLIHGPILSQAAYASQLGMVSGIRQTRDLVECVLYGQWARERENEQRALREAGESSGHGATTSPDA